MNVKYNVVIQKEEEWYVAKCLDNSVASQGKTIEEALNNLKEAIELYNENEEAVKPKEIFITTLEVAIWVLNIQYSTKPDNKCIIKTWVWKDITER